MAGPSGYNEGDTPPIYRIDLSLPPSERYVALARTYRKRMRSLIGLFDELILSLHPSIPVKTVHRLARLFLRRLYTREETEEIQGISKATGISLYFLVALNVVLDLLMGCTSGAARSRSTDAVESKMLHFRTLDRGMDGLRQLVVQLDFFRSAESEETIATSITYVGFVGVLTGVRKDLSLSLNFRPNHDSSSWGSDFRFYSSHLLVLLGIRQSISSLLRQYIIPPTTSRTGFLSRLTPWGSKQRILDSGPPSLSSIATALPKIPTTAAYLIFSDGSSAINLEKDFRSATVHSSSTFIVATNCDAYSDSTLRLRHSEEDSQHFGLEMATGVSVAMVDLIEDSDQRRQCMQARWDKKVRRAEASQSRSRDTQSMQQAHRYPTRARTGTSRDENGGNTRIIGLPADTSSTSSASTSEPPNKNPFQDDSNVTARRSEIIHWITAYPITNECTHYATVMDPVKGKVSWVRRYVEPMVSELN